MIRLRKNIFLVAMAIAACVTNFPRLAYSSTANASLQDITAISGGGIFNNVDVFRIDANDNVMISSYVISGVTPPHTTITTQGNIISSGTFSHAGNVTIQSPADLIFGSSGTVVSTTTTAGSSQGEILTAFLNSSSIQSAAVEGSVLCATAPTAGQGITVFVCNTNNATSWVGIAAGAASTGTAVTIYNAGWMLAQTTGTVNPGDVLVTTAAAAGFLITNNTPTSGTDVAIALGSGVTAGGTVKVRLR